MKRALLVVLVLLLLAGAAIAYLVARRPDAVEDWVARQVVGIANSYLTPRLDYKHVDYRPPLEVALKGVTLTAPDGTRVMDLGELVITLAEVPRVGQPIVMEKLVVGHGQINLVRNGGPEGGFKGLSPITKVAKKPSPGEVPEAFRLSRVMRLKRVELADCGLRYEAPGAPPMSISGLSTAMDVLADPEPGWYALKLQGGRAPAATLALDGRFNLDTYTLDVKQGRLETRLDPQTATTLPPDVQKLLADYDVAGTLTVTLGGVVPLTDPARGSAQAGLDVRDASFAAGGYRLPVRSLTARATLGGGALDLSPLDASVLSGTLNAAVRMDMGATGQPTQIRWAAKGLDLAQMYRDPRAAQEPKRIVGILSSEGTATLEPADWASKLAGGGSVSLREGRLFALPGFLDVLGQLDRALLGKVGAVNNHEGSADFTLNPKGIAITRSDVRTELMGARAEGTVGFDGRLDLRVNAGPMERLQSALGKIGQVIGKVTDQLATYRVTGTTGDPKVAVQLGR